MSESDSIDSDEGIRYKTDSVRHKHEDSNTVDECKNISSYQHKSSISKHRERKGEQFDCKKKKSITPLELESKTNDLTKIPVDISSFGPALPPHMKNKIDSPPPEVKISHSNIGPQLTPHMLNIPIQDQSTTPHLEISSSHEYSVGKCGRNTVTDVSIPIGPQLPPNIHADMDENQSPLISCYPPLSQVNKIVSVGPQVPPSMLSKQTHNDELLSKQKKEKDDIVYIGPQLLPHLHNKESEIPAQVSVGPELPSHINNRKEFDVSDTCANVSLEPKAIGPSLPPHLKNQHAVHGEKLTDSEFLDSEEEDVYGPLPPGMSQHSAASLALEERALQLQIDQLGSQGDVGPVRESWMTELPEAKALNFGLGPRQFRNRAGPDMSDRSSWTDIKGKDKHNQEKKVDLKAEAEVIQLKKRDEEQELLTKKHKRKSKSLVQMHQDKLRKKDEGNETKERRPFNRETDMQVNKFDDAQKKAVLKKAQLLDDRFSSGKSKFL